MSRTIRTRSNTCNCFSRGRAWPEPSIRARHLISTTACYRHRSQLLRCTPHSGAPTCTPQPARARLSKRRHCRSARTQLNPCRDCSHAETVPRQLARAPLSRFPITAIQFGYRVIEILFATVAFRNSGIDFSCFPVEYPIELRSMQNTTHWSCALRRTGEGQRLATGPDRALLALRDGPISHCLPKALPSGRMSLEIRPFIDMLTALKAPYVIPEAYVESKRALVIRALEFAA